MDEEIISFRTDKNTRGLPRENAQRRNGEAPQPPAVWHVNQTEGFTPPPIWGQYPKGFVEFAARAIGVQRDRILHVCAGALPPGEGLRVDIRPETRPDIVADGRRLPLPDASIDAVLIDPPYSVEYAEQLYGCDYPRPSHLLAEAGRVARAGAPIGLVHFLVPTPPAACAIERVYGISTGPGYRIRAFTVMRKEQARLL